MSERPLQRHSNGEAFSRFLKIVEAARVLQLGVEFWVLGVFKVLYSVQHYTVDSAYCTINLAQTKLPSPRTLQYI